MKIIFIGIDGVLNTGTGFCEPVFVENLAKLLSNVKGLHIVISSRWRLEYSLDHFKSIFNQSGISPALLLGITPSFSNMKGREIAAWLECHKCKHFVIIDKEDSVAPLSRFLFSVDEGLTEEVVDEITELLEKLI